MTENANRRRSVMKRVRLTQEENNYIKQRMEESGLQSFQSFALSMLISGEVVHVDFTDLLLLNREIHRIGVNINQIAKYVNTTEDISLEAIQSLLSDMAAVKDLMSEKIKFEQKQALKTAKDSQKIISSFLTEKSIETLQEKRL